MKTECGSAAAALSFIACMPAHGNPDRPDVAWPWVVHSGMRGDDGMASSMGHCVAACGRQVWAEFDPRATGTIRERQLRGLVSQIECPLGVKKPDEKEWKVADAQVAVCGWSHAACECKHACTRGHQCRILMPVTCRCKSEARVGS